MKSSRKTIGILGGMGPESTAVFYQEIIKICQKWGAKKDSDYPEMIIYSVPIPDIVEDSKNKKSIKKILERSVIKLEKMGADFIAIPCNSVHCFYDELIKSVKIPILNIVEETSKIISGFKIKKVGILATPTTIESKLYQHSFSKLGIECTFPKNQKKLTGIILRILEGKKIENDKKNIFNIIDGFKKERVEGVILACTELPILIEENKINGLKIFNTTKILAEASLKFALK